MPLRGADGSRDIPPGFDLDEIAASEGSEVPVSRPGPDGEQLLLFTGTRAVNRWRVSARFIAGPGRSMFELADRLQVAEIAIDIAGPDPVRIEVVPRERATSTQHQWDVRALSGPIDPRALFRLRSLLKRSPAIAAVFVAELCGREDDELIVGFDIPQIGKGAAHLIIQDLIPQIGPLLPADHYAKGQFVALTDDEFAPLVRAADRAIYRRT